MTTRLISFGSLLLFLCSAAGSSAQRVDATLGFARSLHAEGEYYRAITEYKRVLYEAPPESLTIRETAILGVGGALFSGGEYARSAEWLQAHVRGIRIGDSRNECVRVMYRAFLADGAGSRLLEVSRELGDSTPETRLYQGLAHARIRHWDEAVTAFQNLSGDERYGPTASAFAALAQEGERAAWKSPRMAAILGVIPGMGYWYAGHRQTGIASLLVNGLFVGATIQAFRSDQNLLGGFLSLFTVSWYSGNIYGSAVAARRYNDRLQEDLWDRFQY
jgi:hypothetical protein